VNGGQRFHAPPFLNSSYFRRIVWSMTTAITSSPFTSVLVPYDGSEPSQAALAQALALSEPGTRLVIASVVDETPLISEAGSSMVTYDPSSLFEALDEAGQAHLTDALTRCAAAHVTPVTELIHDQPVPAILAASKKHGSNLIIMGTHARTGAARLFLGSTTEGVLRWSDIPVLTIRAAAAVTPRPFAIALVGIADSEASEAAVELAERLVPAYKTHVVELHVEHGNAADGLLAAAVTAQATVVVLGSHGKRGLRGFFLGNVAESVVRASDVPVLVVRDRIENRA
jgi:nucleotide-binding universal stress UspA family protein